MHAILRIDLQTWVIAAFVAQDFINTGRAETLFRGIVKRQIDGDRYRSILQLQVAGLIFFMIGAGQEDRGQAIKGQHTIRLGINDGLTIGGQVSAWRGRACC
jgi:hypothetical protein